MREHHQWPACSDDQINSNLLVVELIEAESFFVIRFRPRNYLVISFEEVLCEATEHVHDPESVVDAEERELICRHADAVV